MSDNAKHYDHFKVEGPAVKTLVEGFKAIDAKRQAIIAGLQAEFDAVAHTNSYGFGDKGSRVCNLVWPADHEFPCQTTIKHRTYFKDAPVVIARGKGNTKEGREFNKQLDAAIAKANSALVGGENGKNYHAVINANGVVVRAADDSRHTSWLCDYLEAVSPLNIRALLAELEAKDKSIAELEAEAKVWESAATKHLARAEEAEKRLATPVRLSCETHPRCRTQHAKDVRAAGFTAEGDE
ncbi:hypothetical protein [Serratia bockelmannii]|uniref:hypothetical protein n=1 Tax=Serratia bockelmannii TaxID=2703793 RepID=UPI003FA754A7